jgi:hypothetical protein
MKTLPRIVEEMWEKHPQELRAALDALRAGAREAPVGKHVIRRCWPEHDAGTVLRGWRMGRYD